MKDDLIIQAFKKFFGATISTDWESVRSELESNSDFQYIQSLTTEPVFNKFLNAISKATGVKKLGFLDHKFDFRLEDTIWLTITTKDYCFGYSLGGDEKTVEENIFYEIFKTAQDVEIVFSTKNVNKMIKELNQQN